MIEQTFILVNECARKSAQTVLANLPIDGSIQIVIGPKKAIRTPDQSSLMWAGPLNDIAEQAWVNGRQYSAETWHEFFKRRFLPEGTEDDYERRITKKWNGKYAIGPDGERDLIGSTTQLSTYGMGIYITEIEAYGASELGVRFTTKRRNENA